MAKKEIVNINYANFEQEIVKDFQESFEAVQEGVRRGAFQAYRNVLLPTLGTNAPKSGKPQKFSKKKNKFLTPMHKVSAVSGRTDIVDKGGWNLRRRYRDNIWQMLAYHGDKGSLLHLLEFGTRFRLAQPWIRSSFDSKLGIIEKEINNNAEIFLKNWARKKTKERTRQYRDWKRQLAQEGRDPLITEGLKG